MVRGISQPVPERDLRGIRGQGGGGRLPDSLTGALDGEEKYEVRFFLLDALGELEKFLYAG